MKRLRLLDKVNKELNRCTEDEDTEDTAIMAAYTALEVLKEMLEAPAR